MHLFLCSRAASLSGVLWRAEVLPTILSCYTHSSRDVTSRGPFPWSASCSFSYNLLLYPPTPSTDFSQAKRAHTHHIDLYFVFHLLQNFSARVFLCFVTAYYTSHERLMILNLACFKAFCSFIVSTLAFVATASVSAVQLSSKSSTFMLPELRSNAMEVATAAANLQRRRRRLVLSPTTCSFKALFLP